MKLSTALKLGRVSNLPTVWSDVLAGYLLAGGALAPGPITRLAIMGSLFYVGGMFLNDVFDAELDRRERPERPIPSGEVTGAEVLRGAGLLIGGGLALALSMGTGVLIAALATVTLIVRYNKKHKGDPAAPLLMGLCRVGLYACAAAAVGPSPSGALWRGAAVLLVYVLGLTFAARHENSRALVRVGPLLGIAAPALLYSGLLRAGWLPCALVLGFCLWVARSLRLVRGRCPASIRRGVVSLIAGVALVDALAIASVAGVGTALLAVAAFLATLALQNLVSGT